MESMPSSTVAAAKAAQEPHDPWSLVLDNVHVAGGDPVDIGVVLERAALGGGAIGGAGGGQLSAITISQVLAAKNSLELFLGPVGELGLAEGRPGVVHHQLDVLGLVGWPGERQRACSSRRCRSRSCQTWRRSW
jgi:hypothetical protein